MNRKNGCDVGTSLGNVAVAGAALTCRRYTSLTAEFVLALGPVVISTDRTWVWLLTITGAASVVEKLVQPGVAAVPVLIEPAGAHEPPGGGRLPKLTVIVLEASLSQPRSSMRSTWAPLGSIGVATANADAEVKNRSTPLPPLSGCAADRGSKSYEPIACAVRDPVPYVSSTSPITMGVAGAVPVKVASAAVDTAAASTVKPIATAPKRICPMA